MARKGGFDNMMDQEHISIDRGVERFTQLGIVPKQRGASPKKRARDD
jgi:hypothetical protein